MLNLPEILHQHIPNEPFVIDDVGMSSSTVVLFSDRVLKIQPVSTESTNEIQMLQWLQGKLPVPKIIAHTIDDRRSYLLMSRMPGKMACDETVMENPMKLVKRLAEGLKRLWAVPIEGCPCLSTIDVKLRLAKENIDAGRIDQEDAEPDTYGNDGFADPTDLWNWLNDHRPNEELVFSHGDYCLPNVFVDNDRVSGFVDLGSAGIADKWQDIALCYRSLMHNYDGRYGGIPRKDFNPLYLFQELGIEPKWEKIRYFLRLDELF